jgi:hypothetical protein
MFQMLDEFDEIAGCSQAPSGCAAVIVRPLEVEVAFAVRG